MELLLLEVYGTLLLKGLLEMEMDQRFQTFYLLVLLPWFHFHSQPLMNTQNECVVFASLFAKDE